MNYLSMITENLSTLKIHKLTQSQYDRELEAGRLDENALYLTPDELTSTPVSSVNGKTGAVQLTASDVGALPNTTVIPAVPSTLPNPSALTINGATYNGATAVDMTDIINYDEAVNAEIRKRYSVSQEFAILRQKDEKPEEYAAYYAYCEECKGYVKAQMKKYEEV